MQDRQQRVVDEKAELDDKLSRLRDFIDSQPFNDLRIDERARLLQQSTIMANYSRILGERIQAFE